MREVQRPDAIEIPTEIRFTAISEKSKASAAASAASERSARRAAAMKQVLELKEPDEERAMKLQRKRTSRTSAMESPPTELSERFPKLDAFVRSTAFETTVAAVILMNCATIGIEVDATIEHVSEELQQVAVIGEHVFCAFFLVEFVLRLCFLGWRIYAPCVPSPVSKGEQLQNLMDAFLVWGTGVFMSWIVSFTGISTGKLRIFTVLRAFRLLRLVRVVRKLPAFNEVYLLIRGLSASTRTLFWTVVVVCLITYIFAIFGVVLISAEVNLAIEKASLDPNTGTHEMEDLEMLVEATGSLTSWMFTLIQVLTLDSWNSIARPLQRYVSGSWAFFYCYIAVAVIVFMNLVTAVIVENALSHSKQDEETLLAQKDQEEKRLMKTFRALFEVMDEDDSGTLTLEEFQVAFETKEVATKLKLLGFKEEDCQVIFNLLDEGDGSLTIDEFFEGLQEMKGPAQAKQCFLIRKRVEQIWNLLLQFTHEEMEMHSGFRWARWREYARDFVEAPLFSHLILVLIIFNVILLGVEVDVSSHVGLSDVPSWMQTANTAIVGVFLLELLLKFIALGCTEFWCAKDSSWNLFDFVIIAISVADVALDILATSLTPDVNTGHLRLIRSIRLARALRSMRMLWLFQYIGGLRTLALSIVSTLGSLFWTLMLLLIIFYSFGVVLTQMVVEHCRYMNIEVTGDNNAIPVCPDDLKKYWSSVPTSMLTLFMSITGGLDWEAPVRPLWGVSRLAVVLVLIFVAITVFAILNAVTGVFCNTAIESAASDKEVASMRQVQSKAKQVDTLRGIFQELDRGKTNELSIEDIHQGIEEGELSNFLESIGISTGDVWTLFMLLDSDQQGCIDLEEFVNGCMQLHGPAKSMQMAKMSFENKITRQSIKQLSKEVRTLRQCLTALLSPSKELF